MLKPLICWLRKRLVPKRRTTRRIRVATFNASLFGKRPGQALRRIQTVSSKQVQHVIATLSDTDPDIVLINEIDFDEAGSAAAALAERLNAALPDQPPFIAHAFASNTGVPTGLDVLGTGQSDGPENAFGFGQFPGQYGFALLTRFPLIETRSFQRFLWKDLPGALLPDRERGSGGGDFFSSAVLNVLRLSSKNHVDAVVDIPGFGPLHLFLSHPTPPAFDGPEQRNRRRNHDEIRLWADYLNGADFLVDDRGLRGGLSPPDAPFVILGDLNADPAKGDSADSAIMQLLNHPRVSDPLPRGARGTATANFGRRIMRVDYVLPSRDLTVTASGVAWFSKNDPRRLWHSASDHRLVWVDLAI